MAPSKIFRPMLGIDAGDFHNLPFPLWATDKIDGIRCLCLPGSLPGEGKCRPVSRSLKPIPNDWIANQIAKHGIEGMDGEITVGGSYHETQIAVMTQIGFPEFIYHVFDNFTHPTMGYLNRIRGLTGSSGGYEWPSWLHLLLPKRIDTVEELFEELEKSVNERKNEGLILRKEGSTYKYGRATLREGGLIKIKLFVDSEAKVVGYNELKRNRNTPEQDERGYQKRSSHKANMVGGGVVGSLDVQDIHTQKVHSVGTGFTFADREEMQQWANEGTLIGRYIKYKFQVHGTIDKPRIPVFLGWRTTDDMS